MEIILYGEHSSEDITDNITDVLKWFKSRYNISRFSEIQLKLSLLDDQGNEVELMDNQTSKVYRVIEIYQQEKALATTRRFKPFLQVVVDNTGPKEKL